MAVYSKTISDSEIIGLVDGKYQNLLLVGCGGCMNESLAYTHHEPIFRFPQGKTIADGAIPIATHSELRRLQSLLESKGFRVRTFELYDLGTVKGNEGLLCIREVGESFDMVKHFPDFHIDAILTLCCAAGTFGITNEYGKDVPILQITRLHGMISYSFTDKEGTRYIDYQHSTVIQSKLSSGKVVTKID